MGCEKFGRIFISETCTNEESTHNENDISWKQIQFASFSNSDLLWYNFDGEVHPNYKKYKGSPFSFGFKLNIASSSEGNPENNCVFEGILDTGLLIGDSQNCSINQTESMHESQTENQKVDEIIEEYQLLKFLNFITGGNTLENKSLLQYVLPCVLPREIGKKDAEILRKLDLSYEQLKKVTNYVTQPLQELHTNSNDDNKLNKKSAKFNLMSLVSPTKLFFMKMSDINTLTSRLSQITMLTKGIQENILKFCDHDDENFTPFVNTVLQTFENGCLENSKEFRKEILSLNETMSPISKELQIMNEGYQVILEAVALAEGIYFSTEQENCIRSSYLFQKFIFYFCTQMDIINKIFSTQLHSSSSAVMECEEIGDLLREYVMQANQNMKMFNVISSLLLKVNEGEDDEIRRNLEAYVKITKRIIVGFILWHAHIYRCDNSNGLVLDCYVHST